MKSYLKKNFPKVYGILAYLHLRSPFFSERYYRRPIVDLVEKEIGSRKHFSLLEIGVKRGGSLFLWARFCAAAGHGEVTGIDLWDSREDYQAFMREFPKHQNVHYRKGNSNDILPTLEPSSYDIIFVDGGHSYSQTKNDLSNALPLLKKDGIICGDDLELFASEVDRETMIAKKEEEITHDPKTEQTYHPGVSLAIEEFFGQNLTKDRVFWAFKKEENHWISLLGQ